MENEDYASSNNSSNSSSSISTASNVSPSSDAIRAAIASAKAHDSVGESGKYGTYRVKVGDSLYSIAKRYPNCSLFDLMRINNMEGNPEVVEGQVIKVPKI